MEKDLLENQWLKFVCFWSISSYLNEWMFCLLIRRSHKKSNRKQYWFLWLQIIKCQIFDLSKVENIISIAFRY
jgi:hypothetical protein